MPPTLRFIDIPAIIHGRWFPSFYPNNVSATVFSWKCIAVDIQQQLFLLKQEGSETKRWVPRKVFGVNLLTDKEYEQSLRERGYSFTVQQFKIVIERSPH